MAQRYLEEAQQQIFKYKLSYAKEVEGLLREVKEKRDIANPPKTSFAEMIKLLYGAIQSKKNPLEPTLRHWYYKFEKDTFKHFYSYPGLRSILYSDDLDTIETISKNLSWLFDYFLIASDENFEEDKLEMMFYPYELIGDDVCFAVISKENSEKNSAPASYEEILLSQINKPNKEGNYPRYIATIDKQGEEYIMPMVGWGRSLPLILYKFIRNNDASKIINGNYFILPINRHSLRDKFYTDIIMSWEMKYIPLYINEDLNSESVLVLSKIETAIPYFTLSDNTKIASGKKLFNSLFKANKGNAKTILNDFKFDIDILFHEEEKQISLSVFLVEISYSVRKIVHPVIVLKCK